MALLLYHFGIVVTIGLCALNGPVSVYGYINEKGPDPRIRFILEPPSTGLVSKNLPLYLPCAVNVTVDPSVNTNQDFDTEYADDDNENNDEYDEYNGNFKPDMQLNHEHSTRHRNDQSIKNKHDKEYYEDEEEDDDDDEDADDYGARRRRRRRSIDMSVNNKKSRLLSSMASVRYTWFRNDQNLSDTKLNGFKIFNNGTLKIYFTENSSGVYRCLANDTENNTGAILSRKCLVNAAVFQRENNTDSNITGTVGYPLVIPCPVKSFPPAEISWYFNKVPIEFNTNELTEADNRYFKLESGNLLITRVRGIDNGKYKCAAINNFFPKSQRNCTATVNVIPFDEFDMKTGLLPRLQNETIKLEIGKTLELFCIGYGTNDTITWTFHARFRQLSELVTTSHMLRIINVSVINNDGVYVCQTGNNSQAFNVIVLSPPIFQHIIMSINTSVAAATSLNCSASGNPTPKLTWYRNGQPLVGNLRMNYDNPILKIYTIDPKDEGIYQCFAENELGDNHIAGYVTVRKKRPIYRKPQNIKCYPINHSTVWLTYDSAQPISLMGSYMASENPYTWIENSLNEITELPNFTIEKNMVPLKTYTIYLRGFLFYRGSRRNDFYHMTTLSDPVKCATQGLAVQSVEYENRIYLWWPKIENIRPKKLTLQFWYNDSTNPAIFSDHIIGTYSILDEFVKWSDVEANFVKIPAVTNINYITNDNNNNSSNTDTSNDSSNSNKKSNITITDVEIPGNVTGILIPNTNKIKVRLLGTIYDENDEIFEQDLRYVEWNVFDGSIANIRDSLNFRIGHVESRSITLAWNNLAFRNKKLCLKICYKNVDVIRHDPVTECVPIYADVSQERISKLIPYTLYRFVLQSCDGKEEYGMSRDVATKSDVPGPVNWHNISKTDGITLFWTPPINANGQLLHYLIQWTRNGENDSVALDITNNSFKFPNVTGTDKMQITIRAVSTSGEGHPIHVSLPIGNEYESHSEKLSIDPTLGIAIGTLLSCVCILFCIIYIIRDRTCKKHGRNLNNNRSLPLVPTTVGGPCTSDVHEMQTLISSTADTIIVPNGYNRNSTILNSNLVVSTDDAITNSEHIGEVSDINVAIDSNYVKDIPPAPDDMVGTTTAAAMNGGHHNGVRENGSHPRPATIVNGNTNNNNKCHNGVIKNLPPPPQSIAPTTNTTTTHSISTTNPSSKTNGNLKIVNNYPQYLNNSTFTLDNSQQILLDTTLDNSTNSDHNDNGDDDDDDDTNNDSELMNESSHSSRPLTATTWNYRRPIIGPNG